MKRLRVRKGLAIGVFGLGAFHALGLVGPAAAGDEAGVPARLALESRLEGLSGAGVAERRDEIDETRPVEPAVAFASARVVGPEPLAERPLRKADRVVVVKEDRRMFLYRGPLLVRSYEVALGFEPDGPKRVQGDGRTPEGAYHLDSRNERSDYYRAIHVSYPNARDRARARARGRSPGGAIMIHGLPTGLGDIGADHVAADWTNGCIAITNEEMDELWSLIDDDTPIHILP